jgi:F-type H+-transporting ATPase subunit d
MSVAKSAAAHIDWTKLSTSLGLKTETVAALSAFRKRNEEARRVLADLKEQKTAVDFAHYRKVLKNQAVIDEVEKAFQSFKPTSYDVQSQIKSIEAVEAKAVRVLFFCVHGWEKKRNIAHLSFLSFCSHLPTTDWPTMPCYS